jgi:uncharacterized protein (TIGR02246 family)
MRRTNAALATIGTLMLAACSHEDTTEITAHIIGLERAALDKWNRGDPQGYLDTYAPEITYFDPTSANRRDGIEAMKAYYAPIAGKVKVSRYEMLTPKVQRHGDVAILSFQLISYGAKPDGTEQALARWNSTEVYRRTDAGWKIAHNHWSFITPELKQPVLETQPGQQ